MKMFTKYFWLSQLLVWGFLDSHETYLVQTPYVTESTEIDGQPA
jgi:hypothetical protein